MALRPGYALDSQQRRRNNEEIVAGWQDRQSKDECCGYCTTSLEGRMRVYRHPKGQHPEPRPTFCSSSCLGYYDNRRTVELRTFIR